MLAQFAIIFCNILWPGSKMHLHAHLSLSFALCVYVHQTSTVFFTCIVNAHTKQYRNDTLLRISTRFCFKFEQQKAHSNCQCVLLWIRKNGEQLTVTWSRVFIKKMKRRDSICWDIDFFIWFLDINHCFSFSFSFVFPPEFGMGWPGICQTTKSLTYLFLFLFTTTVVQLLYLLFIPTLLFILSIRNSMFEIEWYRKRIKRICIKQTFIKCELPKINQIKSKKNHTQ